MPKMAARKMRKGFLDGAGWPFGKVAGEDDERP